MRNFFKSLILLLLILPTLSWADEKLMLTIQGLTGDALSNVNSRLATLQEEYAPLTDQKIKLFYKKSTRVIKDALKPYGYFKADLSARLLHNNKGWNANYKIYLGPRLIISTVSIEIDGPGRRNERIQKGLAKFPVIKGNFFDARVYEDAKQKLFTTIQNQGYIHAEIDKKEVAISLKAYTVAITLHFVTNDRYYVGKVHFDEVGFDERFLKRFLPFKEGDPFSSKQMLLLQQNLNSSHYFANVDVSPQLDNTHYHEVPVDIKLTPNKSQQYNIGLGFGSFTRARITAGVNLRHLNKSGHHMDMQLRLSQGLGGLAGQYVIPGENPLTDQYTIGANTQRFVPKNGSSTSQSLFIGKTKEINHWKYSLTLNYLREYYESVDNPSTSSRVLYPNFEISKVQSNNILNTTKGYKIDLNIRGTLKAFASRTSFAQAELIGKYIFSPTDKSKVLLRADVGILSVINLNTMPLSLQFFAGGVDSIRGFTYSYFGPGRYIKVGSVEYQHQIKGDIYGAVFYDVGTAGEKFKSPLGHGIGVGLIYNSVIGPIRFYVASGKTQGVRRKRGFELSVGPDL